MRNVNNLLHDKARTSIFIAHRLRTVVESGAYLLPQNPPAADQPPADLIIVLKDGQVVEQGTHEELMRAGGLLRGRARSSGCDEPQELGGLKVVGGLDRRTR